MKNSTIAIVFAVVLVTVGGGLSYMVMRSANRAAAPVSPKPAVAEEVKAVVEVMKQATVKTEVKAAEPKAKPTELKFAEATKLAIAMLKKNADAEWAEAMRKFTDSEKADVSGIEPEDDLGATLNRNRGARLRSAGLPKGALYAVGATALNDGDLKPMFEIVWNKYPAFRSVEELAAAAGRVSYMPVMFTYTLSIMKNGNFSPSGLTGEQRKSVEYVFGVETSAFVR